MEIIDLIRSIRKEKKVSQKEIAKILNMTTGGYSNIENKYSNLKADDFIKICDFLDIPLTTFSEKKTTESENKEIETVEKISKKLIALRKKNKYSQTDIAKLLGIGQTTYSRYENNLTNPSFYTLNKITKIYKISINEFLNGKKETEISLNETEIKTLKNIIEKINNIETIMK